MRMAFFSMRRDGPGGGHPALIHFHHSNTVPFFPANIIKTNYVRCKGDPIGITSSLPFVPYQIKLLPL